MDQPSLHGTPPDAAPDAEARYRAFLRSRWPARARLLGLYAFFGSPALLAFDVLFTRVLPGTPPPVATLAVARLPWMLIPVVAWGVLAVAPAARLVPAMVVGFSVVWTWGNAWAYLAAGLGGSPVQALALVLCFITAATFLPLRLRARAAVFAAMAAGQVALDLAWPDAGLAEIRLVVDLATVALACALVAVFESFAGSQRRGLELRFHLEETVAALEASRARAAESARAVGRLAARVAHEVNNPLSAVKVNVSWLAEVTPDEAPAAERVEVRAETLAAVDRIAGIVADLKRQAAAHDPDAGAPGPAARAPGQGAAPEG